MTSAVDNVIQWLVLRVQRAIQQVGDLYDRSSRQIPWDFPDVPAVSVTPGQERGRRRVALIAGAAAVLVIPVIGIVLGLADSLMGAAFLLVIAAFGFMAGYVVGYRVLYSVLPSSEPRPSNGRRRRRLAGPSALSDDSATMAGTGERFLTVEENSE